ncbi:Heat stress transcription factor A-1 [Apostasia shenzhenica]|uniref:Heat stress transcription factor A-1 n=1 Tax=Apostasia shenzhenica TaxID=1088818 RepID=A0A2I0BEK6_9ASPA|nr:Heat stress transcription factor A-1 [Apostasia shenzhenica]
MDGESGGGGTGGGVTVAASSASSVSATLNGSAPPPFLSKTYDMVDDPATDVIVSWGPGNNSFVVWNVPEFSRDLLPKHFKHNNFSSFVRQLNTYGFRKVDPDRWEFANEGFLRGQKHLLKNINRRKPSHAHSQHSTLPPVAPNNVGACVEVGKFGLDEEIERLKRDKNVLMQELVRLRQQQQATDHQLQTLTQRLQGMEQRQQQMMSFLAKAMQSPSFLAQLVQQNDHNRRIVEVSKKRRLPKQENKLEGDVGSSPDGQIIKYQPLMTEAAKAMLMQILKFDSPRLESLGHEDFFMENFPPAHLSDSLSRNSGVTLKEVPSSSGFPSIQSSPTGASIPTSEISDVGLLPVVPEPMSSSSTSLDASEFTTIPGVIPNDGSFNVPVNDSQNPFLNPVAGAVDGPVPIEADKFSFDSEIDIPIDDDSKLPCINDSFWEQFLVESPLPSDVTEDLDSSIQDSKDMHPESGNVWDSAQNMKNLTEQMGLLSSEANK